MADRIPNPVHGLLAVVLDAIPRYDAPDCDRRILDRGRTVRGGEGRLAPLRNRARLCP
ncbi:hypothetical protein [Streptomyces sp. SID8352]|uniref:hypothetical protein n=1 Tax=Streptomyces sp. SID8352 TaxID=2690338 RepID=UPI001371543E|nr:hypothetical protein [Streptomyces sp. SID8352]MYU21210.1 hypothetical protein [Streptomyces sp. SID8352]